MPPLSTDRARHPQVNYWKLAVAIALTWYYAAYATGDPTHTYANWNFLDNVDLVIHEGGHIVFIFFGEFIHILGGSLMQVALPAVFAAYFFIRRNYFSGAVILFWVAQNILYVATYMGDSIVEQLPLLGGDSVIHDWNYLFTYMGVLRYTDIISSVTRDVGLCTIICASVLSIWFSFEAPLRAKIIGYFKS